MIVKRLRRMAGPIAGGVALLAVAGAGLLVGDQYLLRVGLYIGVNVIIVTGLALLLGYAGQVSLGHAAFFGIGAYASAFVTTRLGWPWLAGLATAVALSALGGLLLALPSLRLRGHYLAMATLGFGEIMSVAFVEAKGVTGGTDGFGGIAPAAIGGLRLDSPQAGYVIVWLVAAVALLLLRNALTLRPGRAMTALHGSELGAQACGVDPVGLKVQAFVVSAGLAGVAGALYASFVGFVSPSQFTLQLSVVLLAMAVVGGTRSLAGPVLAAIALTAVQYVDAFVPGLPRQTAEIIQAWEPQVYGLIIILVMLFAPGGAAGLLRSAVRRARGRRGEAS